LELPLDEFDEDCVVQPANTMTASAGSAQSFFMCDTTSLSGASAGGAAAFVS
jgi:hypothetical protein